MTNHTPVFALDFDGVICDGLDECLITAWNAYHEHDPRTFDPSDVDDIPEDFKLGFRVCRSYVRHNGHFLVPFLFDGREFNSQDSFDAAYAAIPPSEIDEFNRKFIAYRDHARTHNTDAWLHLHTIYDGISSILAKTEQPIYIVTAKDRKSVLMILNREGIAIDDDRVYGEQTDKNSAFRDICERQGIAPDTLHFVDDNLPNVLRASADGYRSLWATWGYNTDEHYQLASSNDVSEIDISTLKNLIT